MKVYHFHNGTGGGVWSVIKNLLRFSENSDIENHIIHAVNRAVVPQYSIEPVKGAASQQLYYYSGNNNFYHTCRQLAKLLSDNKAIVVAHDWVELGMASNLGLQNIVIFVLHGDFDYYYELARLNKHVIDAYISISPRIHQSLNKKLPSVNEKNFFLNFPVPPVEQKEYTNASLRLIYYVRDLNDNRKQFTTVIEIARLLSDAAADYFFTIAGGGITPHKFFELWPPEMKDRVNFKTFTTNEQIIAILKEHDIFLLPSLAEGLPVSLVEAMKAGLVPLISNWDGAVDQLVIPGITGYYFNTYAAAEYTLCIKKLQRDRILLNRLSQNCIQQVEPLFNPVNNTKKFEELFAEVASWKAMKKSPLKVYGSRLDQRWLANTFTKIVRSKFKKR